MSESSAARHRRVRSVTESLLSIVLALEAALIFFATVTAFGLKVVSPGIAFGGGAALIALLLLAVGVLRHSWGIWVGWMLQLVVVATGFVLPLMFVIGTGFVAIWVYCFVVGQRLDRRNRQLKLENS